MSYVPSGDGAFASVEYIMRDVEFGWLLRYLHTTGASAFFVVVYLHMFRGLMYGSYREPRELLWLIGMAIFVAMMAEGFFGYLLPWGNMSFWAAQVIVSLFGAIPVIGADLTEWIRGDFLISEVTLNRFFALHVVALPLVLVMLVFVHIVALHHVGSNNPDGIEIKKNKNADGVPLDGIPFHPYYTIGHDLPGIVLFLIVFCAIVFYLPEMGGYFIEKPNFDEAQSAEDARAHRAGLVLHAVLRNVARSDVSAARSRCEVLGFRRDGRRDRVAGGAAVARPQPGQVDALQGHDIQSDAGHLHHQLLHTGISRHHPAVEVRDAAGADLHDALLRLLRVDAVVHARREDEAGTGPGDDAMKRSTWLLALFLIPALG